MFLPCCPHRLYTCSFYQSGSTQENGNYTWDCSGGIYYRDQLTHVLKAWKSNRRRLRSSRNENCRDSSTKAGGTKRWRLRISAPRSLRERLVELVLRPREGIPLAAAGAERRGLGCWSSGPRGAGTTQLLLVPRRDRTWLVLKSFQKQDVGTHTYSAWVPNRGPSEISAWYSSSKWHRGSQSLALSCAFCSVHRCQDALSNDTNHAAYFPTSLSPFLVD